MISFLSSRKKGKKRRKAEKTGWMMPFLPENERFSMLLISA
ncbi:hypothetical protein M493_12555 [Geobacillus genomosp. 3]|uniref:Uncharacterized protein n=1 Tax=Geobacillus genomosp. 3 TaxID=1921421 RepID=S5ZQP1_GEOG3|nr:hypothetical protein M493_12555 [Geobacillus genomosp. 3]